MIKPIGPHVAPYYLSSRPGGPIGRWVGPGVGPLGLIGPGPVEASQLTAVLEGRSPSTGDYLPQHRPARRRAGWDLILSAPKSVSLLHAGAAPEDQPSVTGAHRAAVGEAVDHLWTQLIAGRAGVGAAFDHRTNAGAEPHLHTHLILANLGQDPTGAWRPISNIGWWNRRHELSAVYQLGLRHHLAQAGWDLDWRLRPDGLADLAQVPRAAVRAASSQRAAVASMGRFEARKQAQPQPWRRRAEAAGFTVTPRSPSGRSPGPPTLPAPETPEGRGLAAAVTARLAGRRSDFRRTEVLVALAASHPGGATAGSAWQWSDRFCSGCIPVGRPTAGAAPRWTTALARDADRRLVNLAAGGQPGLVEILASPPGESSLLRHAAEIETRTRLWHELGWEATVKAPNEVAAARWEALTGVAADRGGSRAEVVIIDQVDRRSSPDLLAALTPIIERNARAVLIEGGTLPRLTLPASTGFTELAMRVGVVRPQRVDELAVCRQLLEAWTQRPDCLMVGLGVDEVRGLNSAARHHLHRTGVLAGPELRAGRTGFRVGDRVVAMTRVAGDVAGGSTGTVRDLDRRHRQAIVVWDRGPSGPVPATLLGHGYAVTPALARWTRQPLVLLGRPESVPTLRSRVVEAVWRRPDPGRSRRLDRGRDVGLLPG